MDSLKYSPPKLVRVLYTFWAFVRVPPLTSILRSASALTGLPEELAVTKAALKRNLAVVAFSSMDRELHRCWDTTYPPEKSADAPVVRSFTS